MPRITFRVDEHLSNKIRQVSENNQMTLSQISRKIIDDNIDRYLGENSQNNKESIPSILSHKSLTNLAERLVENLYLTQRIFEIIGQSKDRNTSEFRKLCKVNSKRIIEELLLNHSE